MDNIDYIHYWRVLSYNKGRYVNKFVYLSEFVELMYISATNLISVLIPKII